MKKSIWKFKLKTTDRQFITMPVGAEILTVQVQHDEPCIWALVDLDQKMESHRVIEVFGTGHTISRDNKGERKYIGAYQLEGGVFVGHVFELLKS